MTDRDVEFEGRLTAIEHDLAALIELRRSLSRWAVTLMVLIVVQGAGFIWGYAQLSRDVETLDLGQLQSNTATALSVLGQHGDEFKLINTEQARQRVQIDQIMRQIETKTRDRFYRADGERLEKRVDRLESRLEGHKH